MRLSTSNSDRKFKKLSWRWVLCAPITVVAVFIIWMEVSLDALGYHPTPNISQNDWLIERSKANKFGSKALVFIGGSRIQLGIDLTLVKEKTRLKPIQLAIDDTVPHSVLKNLAEDPRFNGIVIVDYYTTGIGVENSYAEKMSNIFKNTKLSQSYVTSRDTEILLSEWLQSHSRLYADESTPYLSLRYRIATQTASPHFLYTTKDRSRKANYSKVKMPEFYYRRVAQTLHISIDLNDPQLKTFLESTVATQKSKPITEEWKQKIQKTNDLIDKIKQRGGNVIFVGMPTSGMVKEVEEKWYPKEEYWDYFVQHIHAAAVHANYVAELNQFTCPDGSHLDMKDQTAFTEGLISYLQTNNLLPN